MSSDGSIERCQMCWSYLSLEGAEEYRDGHYRERYTCENDHVGFYEDEDGKFYVDLSAIAPYMSHVHAFHSPNGQVYDITYEIINDLEPGTPTDEEIR